MKKHKTIVFKIGISFALISIVLVSALSFKSYRDARSLLNEQEKMITQISIDPVYRRATVVYRLLEAAASQIVINEAIITPFAERDREALEEVVLPAMKDLAKVGIDLYHFHLPDGTAFFRGHRPDEYGDNLNNLRAMPGIVHRDKKRLTGMEQGVNLPAYRHVEPVFSEGEYIGAVELGTYLDESILNIWKRASGGEWYLYCMEERQPSGTAAAEELPQMVSCTDDSYCLECLDIGPETISSLQEGEIVLLELEPNLVQMIPLADFSGNYRWVLKRVFDNSELIAQHGKQRNETVVFGLLIVLAYTGLGFLVLTYLMRPLEKLVETSRVWGRGELSRPVEIKSKDEIGTLAGAMESMRQKLHKNREELLTSRELFKTLSDFATDWIFWVDETNRIVYVSPACESISGYRPEEFKQDPDLFSKIVHQEDREIWREHVGSLATRKHPEDNHMEDPEQTASVIVRIITKQGEVRWIKNISRLVYNDKNEIAGIRGSNTDITASKRAEDELVFLSFHDQLTGVYNRVYFEQELQRLDESREHPITIISADLDGLKIINDTLGHQQGDELITKSADILKSSLRKADILARTGGDEFILILPRTDEETGHTIVERIRTAAEEHNREQPGLPVSISCGVACAASSDSSLEEAFKKADYLMYRDKSSRGAENKEAILENLLSLLSEKDRHHTGHVENLHNLSARLGEKAGLSDRELHNLALLAQAHDLGKVAVPDSILFKEDPLTEEESELLRQHPETGCRIARFSGKYAEAADLVLKHHERWDGSGYPQGLSGEEIPIECRVMAIADYYDELIRSGSPSGRSVTPEEARVKIKEEAGSAFDPRLVDLFLELL